MPCRPAISSMSLGRAAAHDLVRKLDCAARHGFKGIEVFYEDLEQLAHKFSAISCTSTTTTSSSESTPTTAQLLSAASHIRALCAARGLAIICLQPFWHYESLRDRAAHARRLADAQFWIRLARSLGTDLIQIPSTFLPRNQLVLDDEDLMVADLREVADLGLDAGAADEQGPIRFAYEALCWGTLIDTWEGSWRLVRRVDRSNFGVCLDTFHIAGRVFADPSVAGGVAAGGAEELARSLERLVAEVDARKVFYVQVVDGERLATPLVEGHEFFAEGQDARMSWSRNGRLFYGEVEEGGYLPVTAVADALLNGVGFEGWVSFEFFNRCLWDKADGVPDRMARRGMQSWWRLVNDLELKLE